MNDITLTQNQDTAASEAFMGRMCDILNSGAIAVMISMGHRLKLFDTMAGMPPSSSARIAEETGMAERYVREWLAALVTGRIIDYDPAEETYHLPRAHADCLTSDAPMGNIAVYAQMVAMGGAVHDRVIDCFWTGEGTSYGDYPCFHDVMAEDSQQTVVDAIDTTLRDLDPDIVPRLEAGIDVLDAGCGAGRAMIRLAGLFPRSRFVGYDLGSDAVAMATSEAARRGLDNVRFEVRDLTRTQTLGEFDMITSFDAVHDMADPAGLLRLIHAALRPGGLHVMQDIGGSAKLENNMDFDFAPLLYTVSCIHCTPVSIGQGGAGLGTMWGWETAERMLKDAGFTSVTRTVFPHDPMNVWFVNRP